jgi:hypothetical protein
MAAVAVLLVIGCNPEQTLTEQILPSPVEVSMRELMTGVITPATNSIWEGSFAATLSDEDWQRLLQATIQLSLAATAVSLGGIDDVEGGRTDMENWQEWSRQLAELALMAKAAAENRDQMSFAEAGDPMVEVCEACHIAYLLGAQ